LTGYSHIFRPIQIGGMTVKNRIDMAPVGPLLAAGGLVTRELIEWGRAFARGGAGIVTLGDSAVNPPAGGPLGNALNLGTDSAINPLNNFAEVIQRYGARASIQLNYHADSSPAEMTPGDIAAVIESFARAARRCLSAGMDMVMVHGAHGQLLSRFASPRRNTRTDAYGGNLENRSRLAREVLEAIRAEVGDRLAIEYRISGEELTAGGATLEEQIEFARMVQDKIDLIHVSAGYLFEPATLPRMMPPAYLPRGMNVPLAAAFKRALRVPVTAVGSLDMDLAEEVLAAGSVDMVAMARALIADPESPSKAMQGRKEEIRPCVRCNTCIDRTHFHRLSVRCAVNPLAGREAEFVNFRAPGRRKKVVVVGGGPAGMEASRACAARGHDVVLFESGPRLGGTLTAAASLPFKTDMRKYLEWAVRNTLKTPGLKVRLATAATPGSVRAEGPDAVIIAAGSELVVPKVNGAFGENFIQAGDVAKGEKKTGDRVVVAGAGLTGSEVALALAQQGKAVTLIDSLPEEQIDAACPYINITVLRQMLRDLNVDFRPGTTFKGASHTGATVMDKDGSTAEIPCDSIVLALGVRPSIEAIKELTGLAPETYVVGDCSGRQHNLFAAIAGGFLTAMEI
jgi:2,4-dienoyl-CoA reductase-like NADH-dependent reductase (Old Yellow Enzyme family)/NADPH-dependent 2,4-dienoyl-CoA reductase/sulfur reductase-like enzyme